MRIYLIISSILLGLGIFSLSTSLFKFYHSWTGISIQDGAILALGFIAASYLILQIGDRE